MNRRDFLLLLVSAGFAAGALGHARADPTLAVTIDHPTTGTWDAAVSGLPPGTHTLIITASDGSTEEVTVTVPPEAVSTTIRRTGGTWRKLSIR